MGMLERPGAACISGGITSVLCLTAITSTQHRSCHALQRRRLHSCAAVPSRLCIQEPALAVLQLGCLLAHLRKGWMWVVQALVHHSR